MGTTGRVVGVAAALAVGVGAGATSGVVGGVEITVRGVAVVPAFCVVACAPRGSEGPLWPSTSQMPAPLRTMVTAMPMAMSGARDGAVGWTTFTDAPGAVV